MSCNQFLRRVVVPLSLIFMILFLFITSGCVTSTKHASLKNAALPELIPRKAFFSREHIRFDYKVSPDGKKLAWVSDRQGSFTIFFKTIGKKKSNYINTKSWSNVAWFQWEPDSRHLIYSLHSGRKRANHIYRADIEMPHTDPVNLTQNAKNYAWLPNSCFAGTKHILIAQDKETEDCFNLYKVNLDSGEETLLGESIEDVRQWITDKHGNLKGCIRIQYNNSRTIQLFESKDDSQIDVGTWSPKEKVRFLGFSDDENEMWLVVQQKSGQDGTR